MSSLKQALALSLLGSSALACQSGPPADPAADPAGEPPAKASKATPVARNPRAAEFKLKQALRAAQNGDLQRAIQRAQEAEALHPELEKAYLLEGSSFAMQDQFEGEAAAYARGLKALPKSAELLHARGFLALRQGDYQAAIQDYEAARALQPHDPELLSDLAYAYIYVNQAEKALPLAKEAVTRKPDCFSCQMSLGQVELSLQHFDAAVAPFEAALRLAPKDPDAGRSLAKARFLAGDLKGADQSYQALLKTHPDDLRLWVQSAQVALALGDAARAAAHYQEAAKRLPNNRKLLESLAKAQAQAGQKAAQKATLDQIKALKPETP